jgi:hypothetical protein
MPTVQISEFEDAVVIHFATEGTRINAYTLASTLVALADAARAANSSINVGYDIEVVVESVGPGSFRVKIKALYSRARNLFSNEIVKNIIIGVVAAYIYERTLAVNHPVKIEIHTDEVIIQHEDERIVVPRNVYEAKRQAERNPQFLGAVNRGLESIAGDENVTGFGFVSTMDSPPPDVMISRETLQLMDLNAPEGPDVRVIHEQCDLQIIKAILERSYRKWEFMWRGVKISAAITDNNFYERFFAHEIMIAPGDSLKVRLAITQERDQTTGIYSNVGYEVVEVIEHIPRVRQLPLQ